MSTNHNRRTRFKVSPTRCFCLFPFAFSISYAEEPIPVKYVNYETYQAHFSIINNTDKKLLVPCCKTGTDPSSNICTVNADELHPGTTGEISHATSPGYHDKSTAVYGAMTLLTAGSTSINRLSFKFGKNPSKAQLKFSTLHADHDNLTIDSSSCSLSPGAVGLMKCCQLEMKYTDQIRSAATGYPKHSSFSKEKLRTRHYNYNCVLPVHQSSPET